MRSRYNLAFLPVSSDLNRLFYEVAAAYKSGAHGYCLSPGRALPHVTVCQFRADDDAMAAQAVEQFMPRQAGLRITRPYMNAGAGKHDGKVWYGYSVERNADLKGLYESAVWVLNEQGCETLTKPDRAAHPHFTIARFLAEDAALPEPPMHEDVFDQDIRCDLCLGRSDENGQFLGLV